MMISATPQLDKLDKNKNMSWNQFMHDQFSDQFNWQESQTNQVKTRIISWKQRLSDRFSECRTSGVKTRIITWKQKVLDGLLRLSENTSCCTLLLLSGLLCLFMTASFTSSHSVGLHDKFLPFLPLIMNALSFILIMIFLVMTYRALHEHKIQQRMFVQAIFKDEPKGDIAVLAKLSDEPTGVNVV